MQADATVFSGTPADISGSFSPSMHRCAADAYPLRVATWGVDRDDKTVVPLRCSERNARDQARLKRSSN